MLFRSGRDIGWKTLTEASAKPRKIAEKSLKKRQVAGSDLFSVQVTENRLKSATWRSRSQVMGQKVRPPVPVVSAADFQKSCRLSYG